MLIFVRLRFFAQRHQAASTATGNSEPFLGK